MQVIITTIFPNAKSQHKVQGIVGSAVREVRSAHKELTWEIAESTAEERVMANKHEMSIHKFKVSQQGSPMNEKKPSPKSITIRKQIQLISKVTKILPKIRISNRSLLCRLTRKTMGMKIQRN